MNVTFVQIATSATKFDPFVYALDTKGRVWTRRAGEWVLLPAPEDQ